MLYSLTSYWQQVADHAISDWLWQKVADHAISDWLWQQVADHAISLTGDWQQVADHAIFSHLATGSR